MRFTIFTFLALASYARCHFEVEEVYCTLNFWRAANNRPMLDYIGLLEETAQEHSYDMAKHNRISTIGSDGSNPGDRLTKRKYNWYRYQEVVIMNQDPHEFLEYLKARYLNTVLDSKLSGVGVAASYNSDSNSYYYTLDFGNDGRRYKTDIDCSNFQAKLTETLPSTQQKEFKSISLTFGDSK